MPKPHDRLLRVFPWVVLLSALVTVACGEPATSRHAVLGDWVIIGRDDAYFAELKFFPNGKCRDTVLGKTLPFCGWDPDDEERVRLRLALLLPIGRASARVAGDELIVEHGNSSSAYVRVGSKREESQKIYKRGLVLIIEGEPERGIAEWTAAADRGDHFLQKNLAWLLATDKGAKHRDSKKALAYAEMAVAQKRDASYLDTLAATLARDGQFQKAVQVQQEAISLLEKDSFSFAANGLAPYRNRLTLYKAGEVYTEP